MEIFGLHKDGSVQNTFHKNERLTNKKIIDDLFRNGESFFVYPFKILYLKRSPEKPLAAPQVLFTVPKKTFKRAVDRHWIRRRVKEAYRLHKANIFHTFSNPDSVPSEIAFLYTAKEKISYAEIEKKLILVLRRFNENASTL